MTEKGEKKKKKEKETEKKKKRKKKREKKKKAGKEEKNKKEKTGEPSLAIEGISGGQAAWGGRGIGGSGGVRPIYLRPFLCSGDRSSGSGVKSIYWAVLRIWFH